MTRSELNVYDDVWFSHQTRQTHCLLCTDVVTWSELDVYDDVWWSH